MRKLISVRQLAGINCARLSRELERHGIVLPEVRLQQFMADGQIGKRNTIIAEVQAHLVALAGMASVRFGVLEGEPGGIGSVAELTFLMVLPRYRRNGVATKLLDVIEKDAGQKGVWLVVRVDPCENPDVAKAVFAGRGYSPVVPAGFEADKGKVLKALSRRGLYWGKAVKKPGLRLDDPTA